MDYWRTNGCAPIHHKPDSGVPSRAARLGWGGEGGPLWWWSSLWNRLRRLMCERPSAFPCGQGCCPHIGEAAEELTLECIGARIISCYNPHLMRHLCNVHSALRLLAIATFLLLAFAAPAVAQPSGGKTSDAPRTPAKTNSSPPSRSPAKSPPRSSNNTKTGSTSGPAASLDGKWWTSGNDFGASEVVFTQNGSNVSGVIRYADGRTGTVNGAMVGKRLQHSWTNSSGESGSGWLELSWNNFLGGPWHNQKVRDGSWTLMRIEGKWCFGGSRTRIRTVTHNARGEVLSITEDGTQDSGRLDGPWLFLDSDGGGSIKGEMDFRANRMNWSSGFFWSWCGRN
jgi:hypothetical protein